MIACGLWAYINNPPKFDYLHVQYTQSLTMANFFHKILGEFKFGLNTGRVAVTRLILKKPSLDSLDQLVRTVSADFEPQFCVEDGRASCWYSI